MARDGRRDTPHPEWFEFFGERRAPVVERSVRARAADRMEGMVALTMVGGQAIIG